MTFRKVCRSWRLCFRLEFSCSLNTRSTISINGHWNFPFSNRLPSSPIIIQFYRLIIAEMPVWQGYYVPFTVSRITSTNDKTPRTRQTWLLLIGRHKWRTWHEGISNSRSSLLANITPPFLCFFSSFIWRPTFWTELFFTHTHDTLKGIYIRSSKVHGRNIKWKESKTCCQF